MIDFHCPRSFVKSIVPPNVSPFNDLSLSQLFTKYKTSLHMIPTGLRAIGCHLWYLGQEFTPLELFSDQVSIEVKQKMILLEGV